MTTPARLLIAGAVLLAVGLTGGWMALRELPKTCGGRPVTLTAAVSPDIAPAVREVATSFNAESHDVAGRCARVTILVRSSAAQARSLGLRGRTGAPDAWIPDSSIWLPIARATSAGRRTVPTWSLSIATSPVVLATSAPVAAEFRADGVPTTSWRVLTRGDAWILDPATNATGALTRIADRHLPSGYAVAATSTALFAVFSGLADMTPAVVATSEQSVLAYSRTHLPNPAVALTPSEGTLMLNYPLVILTRDPLYTQAADAFSYALQAEPAIQTFEADGFRTVTGRLDPADAAAFGVPPAAPPLLHVPTPAQVTAAMAPR